MFTQLRPAFVMLLGFTILTGIIYPAIVTGLAQVMCPYEANGSIITHDGKALGSSLIGQGFTETKYFWSRPSATTPPYNGTGGSGSNLAPSNPTLADAVKARVAALNAAGTSNRQPIPSVPFVPVDLLTASASGLDPHISHAAAAYQLPRVAKARGINEADVRKLVEQYTEDRDLGILGEPRVNVLELNLALDGKLPPPPPPAHLSLTRWGAMGR